MWPNRKSHEASAITKVLALALLNQDGNKVLVGVHLDALATTQMDFKDCCLSVGRVCEKANPENSAETPRLPTSSPEIIYLTSKVRC
jgi:hypothetical protein